MDKKTIVASVIIPNWNGKHLLEISLPSLYRQTYKSFEIIVVDNGSVDDSVSYVKKQFPKVKIIKLEKNLGFAPAVNRGIKAAKGKYVVLINNDTEVDKYCLKYLIESADKHDEVGMIASKILNFYRRNIIDSAGDYIDAVGHANNIGLGEKDSLNFNKPKYVFLTTGGGSLLKKSMLKRVGLLDEDYFAYFEDVDLCFRAQLLGYKGWYDPRAVIYHVHKATSNKNKPFTEYLEFRNMMMTIIKDFPKELLLKDFNWLKIIIVNLRTIKYLSENGYLKSAIKAELYIITHFFMILRKRKLIQSNIRVPSQYIIDNVLPKRISLFRSLGTPFSIR